MKRMLAFFLAAVLLLSVLPLAGAAFTDEKDVAAEFLPAVNEMVSRNIIAGFSDGSFGPKKTLTRAQAAKILCVVLEGPEKAEALTKTETSFADVPASHWAAKYVAYCADKGIVAGVGDGKFNPDGTLSSAAFAKMLLVAYGADASRYVGADWMKNVAADVDKAFISNNIKEDFNNRALPRQEACQMAFNALYYAEALETAKKPKTDRPIPAGVPENLKILAIGNSFSNDATGSYLFELMQSVGVKNLTIGNLYYSGCTPAMHIKFGLRDFDGYIYYKTTTGPFDKHKPFTLEKTVTDEDWDYIIFLGSSSPQMTALLHYVQQRRPEANFVNTFMWADAKTSTRANLNVTYGGDQLAQYHGKADAARDNKDARFKFTMPTGTVIQNARTSFLGDNLDRDTYHLNKGIARYMASMIWCCMLTGVSPDQITWYPEDRILENIPRGQSKDTPGIAEKLRQVAVESVTNALANPYDVTQSKITN